MRTGEIALVGHVKIWEAETTAPENSTSTDTTQIAAFDEEPLISERSDAAVTPDEAPSLASADAQIPPGDVAVGEVDDVPGDPPVETATSTNPTSGGGSVYDDDLDGSGNDENFSEDNVGGALARLSRTGTLEETSAADGTDLDSSFAAIEEGSSSAQAAGNRQPTDKEFKSSETENTAPVGSDANAAPEAITLDTATVDEAAAGAGIGHLTVSDPDDGDSHSFTVDDARFEVVGNELKLKDGVSLDHEAEDRVAIDVTATDSGNLSHTESFIAAWRKAIRPRAGLESLTIQPARGGPPGKDVDIRLIGSDIAGLKRAAEEVKQLLARYPGVGAIEDDLPYGKLETILEVTQRGRADRQSVV